MIYRRIKDNENDHVWSTESAEVAFHENAIIGAKFNKKFFLAIPGIVTGTGLLFTFLAILVALLGVSIDKSNNQVNGLEGLIGGLSGKFVSSVAALFSATIFLIVEKLIFHRLNIKRKQLVAVIDNLIPRLSPIQVLAEIQRDTSGQSDAFRMFSADLATKLKNSLDQSMGPVLERMVNAIDDLNQLTRSAKEEMVSTLSQMNDLLREAEKGKHETITEQLQTLLTKVENSITSALNKMGKDFNDSLSGSTRDQFSKVTETIGGTASLLEKMNNQFEHSQRELETLITLAKDNYEKQVAIGQTQVENLTAVLLRLGADMKKTIEDSSIESSGFVNNFIGEAKTLSAENAEQLRKLLEKHESELNRVEELDMVLRDTLIDFNNSIKSYSQVNTDLRQVSSEARGVASMMSQVSEKMSKANDAINQITVLAQTQIKTFGYANDKQQEIWQRVQLSMENYDQLFKKVENSSKAIISEINNCLGSLNAATRKGFDEILSAANNTLGSAVGRLSGSIDDLQTFLEELSEEISKFNNDGRGQR